RQPLGVDVLVDDDAELGTVAQAGLLEREHRALGDFEARKDRKDGVLHQELSSAAAPSPRERPVGSAEPSSTRSSSLREYSRFFASWTVASDAKTSATRGGTRVVARCRYIAAIAS